MKTIPTLLTLDRLELSDQLELFQQYFDRIQIDVADGILVPSITTQIDELLELISPNYIDLDPKTSYDFHLMVKNYKGELVKIAKLKDQQVNVNTVLINASLFPKIDILSKEYNFSIGLDVFPDVQIDDIALHYDLNAIKSIQVMTVEPGFQGWPFLPEMLIKIQQLREKGYKQEILIDGGVNDTTIPTISDQQCTPDILCIGSYLTKAGDYLDTRISELKKLE